MIRYTLAELADMPNLDSREDERMIPEFLMSGVEVEVAWEDHEFEETETMIHDLAASVAYAVRMSL